MRVAALKGHRDARHLVAVLIIHGRGEPQVLPGGDSEVRRADRDSRRERRCRPDRHDRGPDLSGSVDRRGDGYGALTERGKEPVLVDRADGLVVRRPGDHSGE